MTVLDAGVALGRRVLRAKPEPATAPTTDHLLRPRLLPDVAVHAPLVAGGPWTAQRGENHYVRLGTDLARLARALDGVRDHAALARVLGPPWTDAAVDVGVVALDRASLLQREQRCATRGAHRRHGRHRAYRPPRLRLVPPFTFQLAVLRSGDRVAGALDRLLGWAFPGIAAAFIMLGIVGTAATVWHWDDVYAVLGSAVDPQVLVLVAASLSLTTVVHELAHAWTLKHYGGRPGRMGVMLFYLAPAFFCDVSDAWRLPRRSQRVKVALAGIVVQLGLGGLAGLAALVVPDPDRHAFLVLYAVGNLAAGLLNALPFVKLDGYIALMSHLDHPNLRAHAIDKIQASAVGFLSQPAKPRADVPGRPTTQPHRWQLAFGLACLLLPVFLVARALDSLLVGLSSVGPGGLVVAGISLLVVLWVIARGVRRVATQIRARGPRGGRIALTSAAIAVAVAGLGALPIPTSSTAGFVVRPNAAVDLVVPEGQPQPTLRAGEEVQLLTNGLLLQTPTAQAVVGSATPRAATAPPGAFAPVRLDGIPLPVQAYQLRVPAAPPVTVGLARFHFRSEPLGELLVQRLLAPVRPTT